MSWQAIGASTVGISHRRTGQPCQDAFGSLNVDDETVVAAVADGAGSAHFGQVGAQIGVQCTLELIPSLLADAYPQTLPKWQSLISHVVTTARTQVEHLAASKNQSARNYAATLLIVVAKAEWIVCGSIGDGAAIFQDAHSILYSLCPPQRGEYANATHFFVTPHAEDRLCVRLHDLGQANAPLSSNQVTQVALLTDGLLELALNVAQNRPFQPFFKPLFAFAQEAKLNRHKESVADLGRFLDSERVNARTHDDKTLLLLTRKSPEQR
ncbi:MAG: PP2C family serine/threonine-protein phosphatase [Chloroflexota bacterium]